MGEHGVFLLWYLPWREKYVELVIDEFHRGCVIVFGMVSVSSGRRLFHVMLYPCEDGPGYTVTVPGLPGCITEGDSEEHALRMAEDAIRCYVMGEVQDVMDEMPDLQGAGWEQLDGLRGAATEAILAALEKA